MEVANPKFTTKWLQGRKPRNTFVNKLKFSVPDHLQYAELLLGLDYKSMKNSMISLISNYKHFRNTKRKAKKVVDFTIFYICVPPSVILLDF
jgi:hypothetical protein